MVNVVHIRFLLSIILLGLLNALFQLTAQDIPDFTIMTEQWPPYNYIENGTLKGISVETLDHMLRRSGSSQSIGDFEVYPWPRAYKTIQEERDTILFTMARTTEREDLFKWVGPIDVQEFNIYGLKSKGIEISSVRDLRDYSFVTLKDDAEEEILMELADLTYDDFFRANSIQHVIQLVAAGRYDLMLMLDSTIDSISREIDIDPETLEPVYNIETIKLYYAFNLDTPDSVIMKFQNIFNEMKSDGTLSEIIRKYNN